MSLVGTRPPTVDEWPIYLNDTLEVKKWKAWYRGLLEMKEIPIDETIFELVETDRKCLLTSPKS